MNDDLLRDGLARIGDQARPVEFLDRALSRSQRIGRNQKLAASTGAAVAMAVIGGLVWQLGGLTNPAEPATPSATPSAASAAPSTRPSAPPSVQVTPALLAPGGLPGRLFYRAPERVVWWSASQLGAVPGVDSETMNVSPDGSSVSFVDGNGDLVVADLLGGHRTTVLRGVVGVGYEPVWSPDSRRLLVATGLPGEMVYGVVTVASGVFVPLAHQPDGMHPLWSADGRHLAFSTGECRLVTADADGGGARVVPVFGDDDPAVNKQRRRSCDPFSISAAGGFVAVHQRTGDEPDGDYGRDFLANAVVDTRTGAEVALPVTGPITAVLFLTDGRMLVRTRGELTLLRPDRTVETRFPEPDQVKNQSLLAYTS
ncbi:hypothetical protein QEZ54_18300 [Catellatospora sp. KI3]|uniref:hypothetical protein n=1 Tax=Catellatospora sp. KI3 TaxID=3041620 RepID=UPI002482404F|nr:hypothetical protein [Catellatospora sp. KI3]MDI1462932.1 hypothetical protein [Catellatospora sp. KI3]